jgi:hypothetical protein
MDDELTPLTTEVSQRVRLFPTSVRVSDVSLIRPSVVTYFRGITPDKRELALVHALEVGVAELLARRRPR